MYTRDMPLLKNHDMRMKDGCGTLLSSLDDLGFPVSMSQEQKTMTTFVVHLDIGNDDRRTFITYGLAYEYMLGYVSGVIAVQSAVLANVKSALGIVSAIGEFK